MHKFKKLALAAAIASTPMMATSLELLDDDMLSGVTGQDGITIKLDANLTVDLAIEDTSGAKLAGTWSSNGNYDPNKADPNHADYDPDYNEPARIFDDNPVMTSNGGFITMKQLGINSSGITIDIDSGSSDAGAGKGVLVVGVEVPTVTISNIDIGVAGSSLAHGNTDVNANVVPADARVIGNGDNDGHGLARAKAAIDDSTRIVKVEDITLTGVNMDIELGPEASQFLALSTNGTLDIELNDFELTDPQGGGTLAVEKIGIFGVDLDATVAITDNGLIATTGSSNMDIAMMGVSPGKGVIGNLYLLNLNMDGTSVEISGR